MTNHYTAIGLMSGTSLDGLDMVAAEFREQNGQWSFKVLAAECLAYDHLWKQQLTEAPDGSQELIMSLHTSYGRFIGECANEFMAKHSLQNKVGLICSHGHTVLHDPGAGYTLQIGDGAQISAVTGIPTVSDLRTKDIALGGQGAPIIPIGERHLFKECNMFLNIGGISNISCHSQDRVTAYDVCPGNTPLNLLAKQNGFEYDEHGAMARKGVLLPDLYSRLETFSFYNRPLPRSLHSNLIKSEFMPAIDLFPGSLIDKLHTVTEHLAMMISRHINNMDDGAGGKIMITGGGVWNTYLVERIRHFSRAEVYIPDDITINYKEAIVMAFFGILRLREEVNCLASVTGARADCTGGALYL